MDEEPAMKLWQLTIPTGLYKKLQEHLFPGDKDEHGAVILAGTCESERGLRLVARELHLARDGVDYVPGKRGYRMLKAGIHPGPDSASTGQETGLSCNSQPRWNGLGRILGT